jgi:hypothetical protein
MVPVIARFGVTAGSVASRCKAALLSPFTAAAVVALRALLSHLPDTRILGDRALRRSCHAQPLQVQGGGCLRQEEAIPPRELLLCHMVARHCCWYGQRILAQRICRCVHLDGAWLSRTLQLLRSPTCGCVWSECLHLPCLTACTCQVRCQLCSGGGNVARLHALTGRAASVAASRGAAVRGSQSLQVESVP